MIPLPNNQAAVNWTFEQPFTDIQFAVDINTVPTTPLGEQSTKGVYIILYDQCINETPCYFGLQTNIMKPVVSGGHEPTYSFGFIFSRWQSNNENDVTAAPGGFIETGLHEGGFIGIRKTFPLLLGRHVVKVKEGLQESDAIWYDAIVIDPPGEQIPCGSIRFPLIHGVDKGFNDLGGTSLELYQTIERTGVMDELEIPNWAFRISPSIISAGIVPKTARATYPYRPSAHSNVTVVSLHPPTVEYILGSRVIRSNTDCLLF